MEIYPKLWPRGTERQQSELKSVLRWNIAASHSLPWEVKIRFAERFNSQITSQGDVIVTSDRFRDQGRNRDDCLEKLSRMLAGVAHPPKARKKTKPSRASRAKRVDSKRKRSETKSARSKMRF